MGKLVIPGVPPGRYTETEIDNAIKDAAFLVGDCKALAVCMNADIASRRLYMAARGQMDAIFEEGWDVSNLPLVIQCLVMSAQERAARTTFTMAELRRTLLEDVLPFLNLLVEQEQSVTPPETAESHVESPSST